MHRYPRENPKQKYNQRVKKTNKVGYLPDTFWRNALKVLDGRSKTIQALRQGQIVTEIIQHSTKKNPQTNKSLPSSRVEWSCLYWSAFLTLAQSDLTSPREELSRNVWRRISGRRFENSSIQVSLLRKASAGSESIFVGFESRPRP